MNREWTRVWERSKSVWMGMRSSIKIIAGLSWPLFSIQTIMNLNLSVFNGNAVRLLSANQICQMSNNCVPDNKSYIPDQPGTKCLAQQVCCIWFILKRWVWVLDMPCLPAADEMCIGKKFNTAAVAMICKLLTEKDVVVLPQWISWGNTLEGWVNLERNDYPGIVREYPGWYPLPRLNIVSRHL